MLEFFLVSPCFYNKSQEIPCGMYSVQCAAVKTNVGVIKEPVHEVLCSLSLKYQKTSPVYLIGNKSSNPYKNELIATMNGTVSKDVAAAPTKRAPSELFFSMVTSSYS